MPRIPAEPPLPDSPATWLANFRYRQTRKNGEHLSPETLGFQLGVSGATVRRWEAGQSNPSEEDLFRFAEVCRLTAQQREFVQRLFARGGMDRTELPSNFRDEAKQILSLARPAYLVDELFFVRAWNSHFADHADDLASALPRGLNTVKLALEVGRREDPVEEAARVSAVVRLMWMWTAHLASSPAYTTLVRDLLEIEAFARIWREIVEESEGEVQAPLTLPIHGRELDGRLLTVYAGEALFPPLYRLFIYESGDEKSGQSIGRHSERLAPVVHFADRLHWAE